MEVVFFCFCLNMFLILPYQQKLQCSTITLLPLTHLSVQSSILNVCLTQKRHSINFFLNFNKKKFLSAEGLLRVEASGIQGRS